MNQDRQKVYIRSSTWILLLQTFLSATILSSNSSNFISFFITSIQVFFGLPLNFLPCSMSIFSTLLTDASIGLRPMWPNHHKRFSLILSPIGTTPTRLRISTFLTLSVLVLPHIHLNIHISTTLIFYVGCFLLVQHSVLYNKEGLTTVLQNFPFKLKGILRSHKTPFALLHLTTQL